MPIHIIYFIVVVIWSTTPLAVFYSNDSLSALAAVNSRMLLAFILSTIITMAMGYKHFQPRKHWKLYAASSIGIFPNMPMVYMSTSYISSGLISVLFALSPFMVAILSAYVIKTEKISKRQLSCLALALMGLCLVTQSQVSLNPQAWKGILLMLGSGFCFSLSNILIQKYNAEIKARKENVHPVNQLTGSLMFALPGLILSWILFDGSTTQLSQTSLLATLYLAIIGSVIGFVAYFYLLSQISALSVSLIPLLTPAFALMIGNVLNDEALTPLMIIGTVIIMLSLSFFNEPLSRYFVQAIKSPKKKTI